MLHLGIDRFTLGKVADPCCGEGHMAEVLAESSPDVVAGDLYEYGYSTSGIDFLSDDYEVDADWFIMNPPFDKSEEFVLKALRLARRGVAAFVRLQWLETVGRYESIFKESPPTLIAFFAERINIREGHWDPDGSTAMAYIWLVWDKRAKRPKPPFWIPPGCKQLIKPADRERFTAHPVERRREPACVTADTGANASMKSQAALPRITKVSELVKVYVLLHLDEHPHELPGHNARDILLKHIAPGVGHRWLKQIHQTHPMHCFAETRPVTRKFRNQAADVWQALLAFGVDKGLILAKGAQ